MSASETCPAREGDAPEHCWHATNTVYTTNPPLYEDRCCHCGQTRTRWPELPPPPEGHGPFHPDRGAWLGGMTVTFTSGWQDLGGGSVAIKGAVSAMTPAEASALERAPEDTFAPTEGGVRNNDAESDGA